MMTQEILRKVLVILREHCDDPAEQLIREGKVLVEIGKALKGMSAAEARATMNAVAQLSDVEKGQP